MRIVALFILPSAFALPIMLFYYEPRCAFCQVYFGDRLPYSVGDLAYGDEERRPLPYSVQLMFAPYGSTMSRVTVKGKLQFKCRYGRPDCIFAKITACGLKLAPSRYNSTLPDVYIQTAKFVRCIEGKDDAVVRNIDWLVNACAPALITVPSTELLDCAHGPEGNQFLAMYADEFRQLSAEPIWTPWAIVDGSYSQQTDLGLYYNFNKTVCSIVGDHIKKEGQEFCELWINL